MDKQEDINKTVADAIWPWKQQKDASVSMRTARRKRSLIQFCCMFFVALFVFFVLDYIILGAIICCLGILVLLGGFFITPVFTAFDNISHFLASAVGKLLTYLLLVPFFYICFFPGRVVLKFLGRDPMTRGFDPERKTYWQRRESVEDVNHYKVQYK